MNHWDERFLALAEHIAGWSKDPSTQVGAVIVRPDKTIASVGFNGLPRGVEDSPARLQDRTVKLDMTVHAEINALAFAKESLRGCTLYVTPLPTCVRCAASIIQHGIARVVSPPVYPESRWYESCQDGVALLQEAGVEVSFYTRWDA